MNQDPILQKYLTFKAVLSGKLPSGKMARAMIKMTLFLTLLFGSLFAYKFIKIMTMRLPPQPPVTVSSTVAKARQWDSKLRAVATLDAVQGVDITTESAGLVKAMPLTSGARVKVNEVLVELNADAEIAQRDSLRALVKLAKITYQRDKSQLAAQAVSQATVDFDKADLDNKKALLAQQEAVLAKKTIRAPFEGVLGISAVNIGQYLNVGDKIVTLQSLDPIYAGFSLPQQVISSLKVGQKVELKVDAYPGKVFTGKVTALDPKVDPATRNVQVEATLPNPKSELYPGMFGEVEIYTGTSQKALVLPKMAISFNPFGEIVYVIQETGKDKEGKPILTVKQTFVTVGESRDDETVILKGLQEGEQVVTAGQLKLKNGTVVAINNTVQPPRAVNTNNLDE